MTTYTWPTDRAFVPESFSLRLSPNVNVIQSRFAGADQSIEFVGARWMARLSMVPRFDGDPSGVVSWINRLRGPTHRIDLWHIGRPTPRGTLRTNTQTAAAAEQFDQTIKIDATTGLTLVADDIMGIALADDTTQLVEVVQNTAAVDGEMTVVFNPPLRWDVNDNAAVTLIRPKARFMLLESPEFLYQSVASPGVELVFREA